MLKTRSIKKVEFKKKTYVLDAKGIRLGKLLTQASELLLGKNDIVASVEYIPDSNKVIIINANEVDIHPTKMDKKFFWHTGYPGGFREITLEKKMQKNVEKFVKDGIWGMLPKNRYGRRLIKNVRVYKDDSVKLPVDYESVQVSK
ncbi:50S ribosomal protein L13 [bacterium]|nr:MAG: 50S ribosomal protein L13 [bacterium]